MTSVPVLRVSSISRSIEFYGRILGFVPVYAAEAADSPVVDISRDNARLQLSVLSGDGVFGSAVNIIVDDVDRLFAEFKGNGLDTSAKPESPVHQGPLNQTWGTREVYVADPDGNTLRFVQPGS